MATASLLPPPRAVFYDANGDPLASGFVYTYVPGGTVSKLTWQDSAETTPNTNPIVLDAAGSCLIYGSGNYQITVTDSLGNSVPAYSGLTADASATAGISTAMQPVVSAASIAAAVTLLGVLPTAGGNMTGQLSSTAGFVFTGASRGQTLSLAGGNGFFSGGAAQLIDNSSGAAFQGSIAGTVMTVSSMTSGYIEFDQYVIFGPGPTTILVQSQLSGTPGGIGTYQLASSGTQASAPLQTYTYATAWAGVGTLNRAGGAVYGLYAEAHLTVAGTATNEFDTFNNSGVNPVGVYPPPQVFGTADHNLIGLQLVAQGNAQSSIGLSVVPGSNNWQTAIYTWPNASSNYGLFVDADATTGSIAPVLARAKETAVAISAQTMGAPASSLNAIQILNAAGTAIAWGKTNGDLGNAGITMQANGILAFTLGTTTTTALAGGASALPALPLGYLLVSIGGSSARIPYYT